MPDFPLAILHRRLGARFVPYRGVEAPADYGDEAAEHAALRGGCGVIDRSSAAAIEMRGEDRARFLGGLVTCDVRSLEEGGGVYGFVTTVKGRVMSDLVVLALDDRLWLELPPGLGEVISQHLRKYVIVDRVEIGPLEGVVPLSLIGPRSPEVLAAAGELPKDAYSHRLVSLLGTGVRLMRQPGFGDVPGWTLWVPAGEAERFFAELVSRGAATGPRPVGHRALDRLRVEAGRPLFGVDFGDDNFPQETGLEDAVSYTKGCYLGQEVVARIHYRGGVNRHLRGLRFPAAMAGVERASDLVGRPLSVEGREVGRVTSAARGADGGWLGLAILHRRAEPESEVEVAAGGSTAGGSARVVELPF